MSAIDEQVGLSEYKKELLRWDTPKALGGYRPDTFQEYPRMLYRCDTVNGKPSLDDHQVTRNIVRDASEYAVAMGQGWSDHPTKAKDRWQQEQDALSEAAAIRAHEDKKLSDKAQAEAETFEATQSGHVAEIPEAKARRRG